MFGLLIFIPLTAVIILKSTHNYKCDCRRDNYVLLVSQYYEEPFPEHSLQIEEPFPEHSLQIEEEPYVPPEEEPEEEEHFDEPSYDPDMKLIFASNMLFANSTKNNHTIFEEQIQIQIPIQRSTIMYFAK
jgi:hypothetical protein